MGKCWSITDGYSRSSFFIVCLVGWVLRQWQSGENLLALVQNRFRPGNGVEKPSSFRCLLPGLQWPVCYRCLGQLLVDFASPFPALTTEPVPENLSDYRVVNNI